MTNHVYRGEGTQSNDSDRPMESQLKTAVDYDTPTYGDSVRDQT